MAKFLTYYSLYQIHDPKEFLGVAKDRENGNIITTIGRNLIIIIQLSTQKQVRSWTVLEKLSSRVLYDKRNEKYVGVFSNKFIRCWEEGCNDINKVKKIKFQKHIADLISCENNEVIIIYSDGTYEYLSNAITEGRTQKSELEGEVQSKIRIRDPKLFDLMNGLKMLTFFKKDSNTKITNLIVNIFNINGDKFPPKIFPLNRQDINIRLAGYTVVDGKNSPSLMTIWSDKRIYLMPLDESIQTKDSPGYFISMLNELNVGNPISICGMSKNCVAIYGSDASQEGAALILYSTQFKIVKSKQFFKIYFDFSRLWVIDSNILLAMGHNLSIVTFQISKELLSEVIGSQVSNDCQKFVSDDFINEDQDLEELLELDLSYKPMKKKSENINLEKNETADGKIKPFLKYENFESDLIKLYENNVEVEIFSDNEDAVEDILTLPSVKAKRFSSNEIELIFSQMKKCGASEQEILEKIFPILIDMKSHEDILTCVHRFLNISENILSKLLKYSMAHLDEQSKSNDKLLNSILSCTYDEENFSKYLRKDISFEQVIFLIIYIYNLINNQEFILESRPDNSMNFDSDLKAFQWFGLLLNTYFQEIALSRDVNVVNILYNWNHLIQAYRSDLKNLEELHSLLLNLVFGKKLSKGNKSSKWYSIEEVKLY